MSCIRCFSRSSTICSINGLILFEIFISICSNFSSLVFQLAKLFVLFENCITFSCYSDMYLCFNYFSLVCHNFSCYYEMAAALVGLTTFLTSFSICLIFSSFSFVYFVGNLFFHLSCRQRHSIFPFFSFLGLRDASNTKTSEISSI